MLIIGGIIAAVVIVGGAVLLMNSSNSSPQMEQVAGITEEESITPTLPAVSDTASPSAATNSGAVVKTFTLEGGGFRFTPNEIRVKKGDKVKVVLNVLDMQHDFVVDELDIRTKIGKAGETVEVEFTANTAGEFEFYCSVGSHRAQGMVGTFIVE